MKNQIGIKALRSGDTIVLHYKGETLNVQKATRPSDFRRVEKLLESGNIDELETVFIDIKKAIEIYSKEKVTVQDGKLKDKQTGQEIPSAISKRLMEMKNKGVDFMPLWRFWQKLKTNPSKNSIQQLYNFVERHKVPLTPLGDMILEKGVHMKEDGSLWDDYTKTIDNSIGMIVEVSEKDVVDDPKVGCARGLHIAAPEYVRNHYSNNVVVECLVNPRDVRSVPEEYNFTKMRVMRYQVLGLAKHSSIDKLVVKIEDLVELPEQSERRKHRYDNVEVSLETDLMKLTASKIIQYVRKETGKQIKIDKKNKQAIVKKATQLLSEHKDKQFISETKDEFVTTGKNCSEIVKMIEQKLGKAQATKLAGSDPRRGRLLAKLKQQGYKIVD